MKDGLVYVVVVMNDHGVEPVGVYACFAEADEYRQELEMTDMGGMDGAIYDVLEFEMDSEPPLLSILKKRRQRMVESLENCIADLLKRDLIDQLIGEDGEFYYVITDLGKESASQIPTQVRKFFKK